MVTTRSLGTVLSRSDTDHRLVAFLPRPAISKLATRCGTARRPVRVDLGLSHALLVRFANQGRFVEVLCARRDVERWVLVEEVDWLHRDLDDLARHHWEVLDTWYLLKKKKKKKSQLGQATKGFSSCNLHG